MNKMNYLDYTVPVGKECLVPSRVEALAEFNKLNLRGRIYFGIIHTDIQTEVIGWVLKFRSTICPLKAFKTADERLGTPVKVSAFSPGTIIKYNGRYYLYAEDPVLQTIIREITIFTSTEDILNIARCDEEEAEVIGLYEMELLNAPERTLFPAWMVHHPTRSETTFIPVFVEDAILYQKHGIYNFNWSAVSPGYRIKHDGTMYQLYSRNLPEGGRELFINKAYYNPYMKILKT